MGETATMSLQGDRQPEDGAARPRRGRPPKDAVAPGGDARTAILDAAEELFAKHGLHGVSLRQVAARARVDGALPHYYFDSKRGVFDAVFMRRAELLNAARIASLDAYEAGHGDAVTVEGAVRAFLEPVLGVAAEGDRGWLNYFALIAQVSNTPEWGGETMARFFDPVIRRLLAVLRRAMPGCRDQDLYWSYHMLSGALMLTLSESGRIDILSGGLCRSDDMAEAQSHMIAFAAAGFRAACVARSG